MIYTLTVQCVSGAYLREECIRVIEIPENYTLAHLHDAIQDSVGFGKDHPYEFYAARTPRGKKTFFRDLEDGCDQDLDYLGVLLSEVWPLSPRKLFYLFDFGDMWIFEVRKARKLKEPEPGVEYPRVVEAEGPNPEQYPVYG